jgi:hypothetical protein
LPRSRYNLLGQLPSDFKHLRFSFRIELYADCDVNVVDHFSHAYFFALSSPFNISDSGNLNCRKNLEHIVFGRGLELPEPPTPLQLHRWASYFWSGGLLVSRKHWSDLFLFVAAINLVLAAVLNNSGRLIAVLAVPGFLVAGTLVRRRMV